MHVENLLGNGKAWSNLNIEEKMAQMHVAHALSPREHDGLLLAFDLLDPGEDIVSATARAGVIDVENVHPALAAK